MVCKKMRFEIVTILYLTTITCAEHNPKVHEDVIELTPSASSVSPTQAHQIETKHSASQSHFNFQRATHQQDPLRSRYAQQQLVDLGSLQRNGRNRKLTVTDLVKLEAFLAQNRGKLMLIPFDEPLEVNSKSRDTNEKIDNTNNKSPPTNERKPSFLIDVNDDNPKEIEDRKDNLPNTKQRYIFIQPSILKNNFGLDSKVAQQILQRAAPQNTLHPHDQYQISALQDLIGKNPNVQLEGLTRLLSHHGQQVVHSTSHTARNKHQRPFNHRNNQIQREQSSREEDKIAVASTNQETVPLPKIELGPNRTLEDIQKELDEVSKLQAQQAIAQAQKYALAQVEAQHKAIAQAQSKAQHEALAKFAAQGAQSDFDHQQDLGNQQMHQYVNENHIYEQQEVPAASYANVHESIPYVGPDYNKYTSSSSHYASHAPEHEVPAQQHVEYGPDHNFKGERYVLQGHSTPQPETYQQIILESNHQSQNVKQVFMKKEKPKSTSHNDLHQYAAKYAFGYRILDAKQGNDFGHEEQRNGKSAKGHYHVLLPDGRLQKVEYYADDDGYHAKVTYQNNAKH